MNTQKLSTWAMAGLLAVALVAALGGQRAEAAQSGKKEVRIGFSFPFLSSPFRVGMMRDAKAWLEKNHPDWKLIITDAQGAAAKQINDVEDLLAQKVDVILMSPIQAQPLVPVARKVMVAKIPLITVDRELNCDDCYTAHVGGDNVLSGRLAAAYIAKRLNGRGNVVYIQGQLGASAVIDIDKGFKEEVKKYPGIKIIVDQPADYKREKALALMEDVLQAHPKIDAVYAMGAEMAFGAMKAIQAAGRDKEMFIVSGEDGKVGFDGVKRGEFAWATTYPTASAEALELAEKVLTGESVPKRNMLEVVGVTKENVDKFYDKAY